MIINRKIKTIVTIILIIAAMSFMAGCKSKTSTKVENSTGQTEQNSTNTEDKQQSNNVAAKETTIDEWKFDVPEGYKIENNGGPWYEKRYANDKGAVLLFGYYAPNGIDNRTDKQIFDEQVNNEEQDFINRYGGGEVTYKDINNDKMYSTIYYETRDLKVLKRSIIKEQVWKTIYIEIPISENEKDYENILDTIE
jgi:hypothetical protein